MVMSSEAKTVYGSCITLVGIRTRTFVPAADSESLSYRLLTCRAGHPKGAVWVSLAAIVTFTRNVDPVSTGDVRKSALVG